MATQQIERRYQVGRVDAIEFDASNFLAGESITAVTITPTQSVAAVSSTSYSGSTINALIQPSVAGVEYFHVEVDTATRSRCWTVICVCVEDC